MKAILIDPFNRSVEQIETDLSLPEVYQLVGEDDLDFCWPFPGRYHEVAIVGDHSALQMPPLPRFFVDGYIHPLYGRTVVYGVDNAGETVPTRLTVRSGAGLDRV